MNQGIKHGLIQKACWFGCEAQVSHGDREIKWKLQVKTVDNVRQAETRALDYNR